MRLPYPFFIGVPIGQLLVERIVAMVYCPSDSIDEFITLSWTPTADQRGPEVFCAAPVDNRRLTVSQHCINYVVGFAAPNLIPPTLVQGTSFSPSFLITSLQYSLSRISITFGNSLV